jgi:tetratricopeptide (TPR) repeat protein
MPPKLEGESEQAEQAFAAGNVAKQAGNLLGALAEYSAGLESALSVELRSALLVNRSITLATLGRFEEALADGLACAELRPSWSRTYECQAAALHGLGHMQEADASARLAAALAVLKKDPKNAESKQRVKEIRREARELQAQRPESQALQAQPSSPGFTPQTAAPGAPAVPAPHAAPEVAAPEVPAPAPHAAPPSPPRAAQPETGDLKEQATNLIVEGNARQQDKDYEGALACYSSALQLSQEPDMTSAIYFNCSIANSYMERFEDALKDAEDCIRVNPAWPRGFECKGTALEVRFFPRGNL